VSHSGGGTGTRGGVFIYAGTNYIWFGDDTEDGVNWGYNWEIGSDTDKPNGTPIGIPAFGDLIYRDGSTHKIKIVANGQTVGLYLDGVFGTEVPFPFSSGLKFAVMAAGRAETDTVVADFDNAAVSGSDKIVSQVQMTVGLQNGDVVVSWTGAGMLQQADTLTGSWTDIPSATSPYIIPANALAPQKFYRVRQ
jgi:hypothetical protein